MVDKLLETTLATSENNDKVKMSRHLYNPAGLEAALKLQRLLRLSRLSTLRRTPDIRIA